MSAASIIASNYSGAEIKALQKKIFPAIIMDLPKQVLDSEAAKEVNQRLSKVAFRSGVVKEQNLPNMPLVCGVGNSQEAQLS
jgi:hypothetical protein